MKKKWSKENSGHLLKVLGFIVAANVVGGVITWLGSTEFPAQYALWVGIANTVLVAGKEWLNEHR